MCVCMCVYVFCCTSMCCLLCVCVFICACMCVCVYLMLCMCIYNGAVLNGAVLKFPTVPCQRRCLSMRFRRHPGED